MNKSRGDSNNLKIKRVLLTAGATALSVFVLFGSSVAYAAGPWFVSATTGNDANDCLSTTTACLTIQAAVDKSSSGDTVNVEAGTYPEHVSVSKSLDLEGANSGIGCLDSRSTESAITGDAGGALQILSDDVTVNGFQVSSSANSLGSGIWTDDSGAVSGFDIRNNLISQSQVGMAANSNGPADITCNVFDGNNQPGSAGGTGIYSANSQGLTIDHNEFLNHVINNPVVWAVNSAAPAHEDLTFSNNQVHDNAFGLYILGLNNATFSGNDISATDTTALSFAGGNSNVTVTQNTIHDSARGVRFENGGFGCCGQDTNVTINNNSITGNTEYGVGNISEGHEVAVDATCNWWGAADGPSGEGSGAGDAVTPDVSFDPFLSSDDLSDTCPTSTGGPFTLTITVTSDTGAGGVVTSSDGLINCGNTEEATDCEQTYAADTEVELNANPDSNSGFEDSWTVGAGTCTGTTTPCTVTVTAAGLPLTAHFSFVERNNSGGGGGNSNGGGGSGGGGDNGGTGGLPFPPGLVLGEETTTPSTPAEELPTTGLPTEVIYLLSAIVGSAFLRRKKV